MVKRIIQNEQPIHFEDLCKRIAPLYGNQKATSRITGYVENDLRGLRKEVVRKGDFITLSGFDNLQVRVPQEGDSYVRPIEYISDDELELAILSIARNSFGLTAKDLRTETTRELGFKHTGQKISTSLDRVYGVLLRNGKISEIDGKVTLC